MKTLIVLSAPPGSGKTTWARALQEKQSSTYIISSDEIRYELTGQRQDFSKQKEVWETFSKRIHEYANLDPCATVILDALCDLNILRKKYVWDNPEYDRYILVLFPHTKEECAKNNVNRDVDYQVPDNVFEGLWNKFEPVSQEVLDLYTMVFEVKFDKDHKFKQKTIKIS